MESWTSQKVKYFYLGSILNLCKVLFYYNTHISQGNLTTKEFNFSKGQTLNGLSFCSEYMLALL